MGLSACGGGGGTLVMIVKVVKRGQLKQDLNNEKDAVIKDLRAEWSKPVLLNQGDFASQGNFGHVWRQLLVTMEGMTTGIYRIKARDTTKYL